VQVYEIYEIVEQKTPHFKQHLIFLRMMAERVEENGRSGGHALHVNVVA